MKKPRIAKIELTEVCAGSGPSHSSAVAQAYLEDGRQFSILTATPSWFERAFAELGLRCWFGPSVLFVREVEPGLVARAISEMLAQGDRWLCQHDTPRTTLSKALADFKSRHP